MQTTRVCTENPPTCKNRTELVVDRELRFTLRDDGKRDGHKSNSLKLRIQRRKESKGKRTKVFVRVVTPSSAPELARRCPFPAVTHPTRRGLARHIRVNSDGTTLLCVRRRNRTPAVVLLELANCTIRIRVDPHRREVADPIVCPQVTTSLTTLVPLRLLPCIYDDFVDDFNAQRPCSCDDS